MICITIIIIVITIIINPNNCRGNVLLETLTVAQLVIKLLLLMHLKFIYCGKRTGYWFLF